MSTVGFIGLGIMGAPMAENLLRAGHQVVAYNRSPEKADRFAERGGTAARSIRDAVSDAEYVVTMLPDSPDVEEVMFSGDGVFAHARSDACCIDMSTVRPDLARRIARCAVKRGISTLDAPVSGGDQAARDGSLSIMVGGDEAAFHVALPLLQAMGRTIVHVGPAGSGQTVKAANQLIVAGTIGLVAEAIVFLKAQGVETEPAIQVLTGGLAGNRILERKAPGMLARDFTPGFRIALHDKDLGIYLQAAREQNVVSPLGAQVAQLVAALKAQGHGRLDHSALLLLIEQLSGRTPG